MTAQPLLIALVSVQFLVHALVWAMTARMARRWREAEGHFALFWFMLATPPTCGCSKPLMYSRAS